MMIHLHSKIKEGYTSVKSVEIVIFCFKILQGACFLDVDYFFSILKRHWNGKQEICVNWKMLMKILGKKLYLQRLIRAAMMWSDWDVPGPGLINLSWDNFSPSNHSLPSSVLGPNVLWLIDKKILKSINLAGS